MKRESEFYVGYLPIPAGLRQVLRRVLAGIGAAVVAIAVLLVMGQHPFADSTFEFQQYREFQGALLTEPYPALMIPGQGLPWLLVGYGKHGVDQTVRDLVGREVRLKGARIIRDQDHMIELLPGSIQPVGKAPPLAVSVDLGHTQLTGEIVDSKCYFGVMNPGNGKVHRDCAVRCISGGTPPAFLVRDSAGRPMTLLLADWKPALLDRIAEPVTLSGRLERSAGRLILHLE